MCIAAPLVSGGGEEEEEIKNEVEAAVQSRVRSRGYVFYRVLPLDYVLDVDVVSELPVVLQTYTHTR